MYGRWRLEYDVITKFMLDTSTFYFLTGGALHKQKQITSRNNESSLYVHFYTIPIHPHCHISSPLLNITNH